MKSFKQGLILGNFQSVFFLNVVPLHQKRLFFKNSASFLKKNKKTSYTLLMNNWKILQVRKVSNRTESWKIFQVFFFSINVFPLHQKRFFFKNNASFLKKNKKTSYTLLMNNWKILQVRKDFNRAESWKIFEVFFFNKRPKSLQQGRILENFELFFFNKRLSTAPKASFFQK